MAHGRRPRCRSISVSSIRSKADFAINRNSPLRSSIVVAWLAISPASCSARDRKEASMRWVSISGKGLSKLSYPRWLTQDFLQGRRSLGCRVEEGVDFFGEIKPLRFDKGWLLSVEFYASRFFPE